ncbi:Protein male-specific lethal-1 [Lucilia cuprina]|uniref:Protein male-specific lethal-1 n=1 Tax=Lucilia cuprina TaxID=7375 RepID=A0A0L0BS44_LUCCU|nr:Protein male-specific lethal-1 [Lucilia cuprina]KNC22823.1 Protein male-specific lethal-1 [Lucilia cuprina]
MENKCNKTPNNSNNNNTNSKYMDHVYCHTNQTKNSYNLVTTPGSVGSGGGGAAATPNADILALLKENKQLKAMLILHLDLIQEQSDQLMAKEKLLIARNEEIEAARSRSAVLESQVKELQKQLQQQIKRSGEVSTLPPPPLAKIQCKTNQAIAMGTNLGPVTANCAKILTTTGTGKSNIIGECNGKLISKIVLQRVNMAAGRGKHSQSPQSQTTDTENDEDGDEDENEEEEHEEADGDVVDECLEDEEEEECHQEENQEHEEDEDDPEELAEAGEIEEIEHSQDSVDDKSNTPAVVLDDLYDTGNTTEDSNEVLAVQSKRLRLRQAAKQSLAIPRGAKPSVSPASTTTNDGQTAFKAVTSATASTTLQLSKQPPTPSRGKQMTIMRWHAPDYNTDESVSCDSTADVERRSTSTTSSPQKPSPNVIEKKRSHDNTSHQPHHCRKIRRCAYISTPQLYSTREWEDEAFSCDYDYEFFKAEAKLLQSDNPKLEIPKWTEHELTPSYCIEGTEDLSDEIFLKRHAKLEVDEKRRKKWDVQQIREQRRIERLKRRHCKDEIQPTQDTPSLQTFYPTTEQLQTICFVHDLPVQAFGEMIPRLTAKGERRKGFQLPWMDKEQLQFLSDNNKPLTVSTFNSSETTTTASAQMQQQLLNSSFTFLKKRRRQQSSSFGNTYPRQRNQASRLAHSNTNNPTNTLTANTNSGANTSSTQNFLNIVKSNVATSNTLTTSSSTSLTTTTPLHTVAASSSSSHNSNVAGST